MKNQIEFVTTAQPNEINTQDGGHTKTITLYPEKGDQFLFVKVISFGKDHPEFDILIKPGKKYIVHIEEVEE
jgi:hypothetical protein